VLGALVDPAQQSLRAPEPARGERVVAAEVEVVGGEPHRHPCRTARVVRRAMRAVRALAGVDRQRLVGQPPRRPAQPLQRGRDVAGGEESFARSGPVAAGERVLGGLETGGGGGHGPPDSPTPGRAAPVSSPPAP
jgi:hypothetical protein